MQDKAGWIGLLLLGIPLMIGLSGGLQRSVPSGPQCQAKKYCDLSYGEASRLAVKEIRKRGERLSQLNCKTNISVEELREEYGLNMPPRVNHNIIYRCAQLEDLEKYTANKKRSEYFFGPGKKVKLRDSVIQHNETRLKEGSYKPQLYVLEDAVNFNYNNLEGFSEIKLFFERTEACAVVYGLPASRNMFTHEAETSLYCGMEVLEVKIPEVVYRRNHYGNFYEYDYVHTLAWEGRELPALDPEGSWKMIVHDENPSRYPFVWRAEMKVKLKTGVIAYVEWDWVEDGMPDSSSRKDPRWSVSSVKPDLTKWVAPFTICSLIGSKTCSTVN